MLLFDRRRQHDDLACAAWHQRKASLRRAHVGQHPQLHAKSPHLDPQPRAMRLIGVVRPEGAREERARGTSPGQASPSARASANKTGRVASETTMPAPRTTWRHASTTSAPDARSVSTSSSRSGRSSPRAISRAAGVSITSDALSTSAVSAGMSASRAACRARASAARAAFARRHRIAIPTTTSSWVTFDAGGSGVGVELGERTLGLVEAADQEQATDLEHPRMRGVHPVAVRFECRPRCVERHHGPAQVARDQRDLGLGDDAPRASHRLFRTEGARRTSQQRFARTRSPSCAIAMPRSARAGASSRRATRFSAPSGSPAASARPAAVISESIGIPPRLDLSRLLHREF